jgi:hypothetical protein
MNDIENRHSRRFECSVPLRVGLLNQDWRDARALNFCSDGMCFKIGTPLHPGSGIVIRVVGWTREASFPAAHKCLRTMIIGEVKWCSGASGETAIDYTVGVKYFPNYY